MSIEIRDVDETIDSYEIFKKMYEKFDYNEGNSYLVIKNFEEFQSELEKINIYFIVEDDDVIGYIIMGAYDDICQIHQIYIKPEVQRMGFGKKAIEQVIKDIEEIGGFSTIKVLSANILTDNFYSRCGFKYLKGDVYEYHLKST